MRNMTRCYLPALAGAMLAACLTACGGSNTTVTSTTAPGVFYAHSVAFRNSTTFAWGSNAYGQLGDGTGTQRNTPVAVAGLANIGITGFSAGGTHTLAFKNNSSAYAWGNNGFGQLGNNSVTASTTPVQVLKYFPVGSTSTAPLSHVTAISAGGEHSLAIVNDTPANPDAATVWAWGSNYYGQLGDYTLTSRAAAVPVQDPVAGSILTGVTQVSAGGSHNLALRTNGTVSSWGYNGFGQLGGVFSNISTLNRSYAGTVYKSGGATTLGNVIAIAAGGSHSLFALNDGSVWGCGYNLLGQVGDGTTTDQTRGVVQVPNFSTGFSIVPAGYIVLAAGADHSLALKSDGTVWGWGFNFYGQLGNGATLNSNTPVTTPVEVLTPPGTPLDHVTQVFAIGNHSIAVRKNPSTGKTEVYAWGDNTFGQLGNNAAGAGTNSAYAILIYSYP